MEEQELKKKKQYILMFVLVIIVLMIFVSLLKNVGNIDYSDISGGTLIKGKPTITNRETYYTLEQIIAKYISSYEPEVLGELSTVEVEYDEYYNVLSDNYKKDLSKSEYKKVAKNFLSKFVIKTESSYDMYTEMKLRDFIYDIYEYETDMYICTVGAQGTIGYIGIELNTNNNTYSIFYLE